MFTFQWLFCNLKLPYSRTSTNSVIMSGRGDVVGAIALTSRMMLQSALTIVSKRQYDTGTPPINELRLRQMTLDEALPKLDQFLHDTFMAGLIQVRVIHGKGTGTLRQTVRRELKRHPLVKSYRPGDYGEGGEGVTIVELAEK
jgi:dsDNA-specific endonuclease/ATPase MutS2